MISFRQFVEITLLLPINVFQTVLSLMDEKADRKQLENKASKQWVDSTFSQLDEEIRNARAKMQEQEDALRLAMEQMGGEVEHKLDKEEIEPLKTYLDEKLKNLPQQQAVENMADIADSAAGMRKPVRTVSSHFSLYISIRTFLQAP